MAKRTKKADAVVSKFAGLVKLADRFGQASKAKTTIKVTTEEGTVNLTVSGKLCLDDAELSDQAAKVGGKMTYKAEAGFGEASGGGGTSFDGRAAAYMVDAMCSGEVAQYLEDESETASTPSPSANGQHVNN